MPHTTFSVKAFGNVESYSPTLSRARVRIFYKGANRNSTYITEEFADKLLSTLSYTPVKGIYEEDDFTTHGEKRSEGRIYGVVPENPNLAWEKHLDDDGVTRTYACADVLLFTALYPEAKEIPSKGQSMEIYTKSIKGQWQFMEGKRQYVYTDGCFLGLQALGDDVEPCFEGAEFFSLYTKLKNLVDTQEGGKEMINFKLSDRTKHDLLFNLINPNYTSEGNWEVNYSISEIYDGYALCFDYETQKFCRWYYQKDDTTDEVTLGNKEDCYIVDVTDAEYKALNLLKAANGETFEKVDEVYTAANNTIETLKTDLEAKTSEFDLKVSELETANNALSEKDTAIENLKSDYEVTIATLTTDKDAVISEKDAAIETLTGELSTLKSYKDEIEGAQKDEIIAKYSILLDEETMKPFVDGKDTYEVVTLKKELAFIAMEKNPNVFTQNNDNAPGFIPTGGSDDHLSEATKLIMKHRKKQ